MIELDRWEQANHALPLMRWLEQWRLAVRNGRARVMVAVDYSHVIVVRRDEP